MKQIDNKDLKIAVDNKTLKSMDILEYKFCFC